jgi:hypothetical protein
MHRNRRQLATLLGLAASVVAAEGVSGQRSDTIVKTAGPPRYRAVATVVPELRIGMVDGPPEYLFGAPFGVLLQKDGSIVVIDYAGGNSIGAATVRRYDRNGKFIRNIGRNGEGPGEYRGPTGLAELTDGKLAISDPGLRRITTYSATGDVVSTWSTASYSYPVRGVDHLRAGPDGTVYMRYSDRVDRNSPPLLGVVRFNANGTVRDTLRPPTLPSFDPPRLSVAASPTYTVSRGVPFWPSGIWTFSPQGHFITAITNRYAIDINQDGRVTSIRRVVPPVTLSDREREEQREYVRDYLRFYGPFNGSVPEVPRTKPYFKFLSVFEDGRIWAALSTPSERYEPPEQLNGGKPMPPLRWREPNLFDVFEADGTYVGQVSVPYDVVLRTVRGDVAWGYVRGDEDVPLIVRYRITWQR